MKGFVALPSIAPEAGFDGAALAEIDVTRDTQGMSHRQFLVTSQPLARTWGRNAGVLLGIQSVVSGLEKKTMIMVWISTVLRRSARARWEPRMTASSAKAKARRGSCCRLAGCQ